MELSDTPEPLGVDIVTSRDIVVANWVGCYVE